jgi:hypothetical protein
MLSPNEVIKRRLGTSIAFALLSQCLALHPQEAKGQTIRIRVLDGTKGTPITQGTIVWIYDANDKQLLRNHTAHDLTQPPSELIDVEHAEKIGISSNGFYDCRNVSYPDNLRPTYSVKEIISSGIIAVNFCGNATSEPEPGVLTFYVRPFKMAEQKRDR